VRVALNFSRKRGKPPHAFTAGMEGSSFRVAAGNTGRRAFSARYGDETLAPWEAAVLVVEHKAEES
jgi:hypothetical protein